MGISNSTTKDTKRTQHFLNKALQLFQKIENRQTKFFGSDVTFAQNNIVVETVVRNYLGPVNKLFHVIIEPQNDKPTFTMRLSPELLREIKLWLYSPAVSAQFLCSQIIHGLGHTVLLILKKKAQGIYVLYLDPHGFPLQQSQLLAAVLSESGIVVTVPVIVPVAPRDPETALWHVVGQTSLVSMKQHMWGLYLFYTCHRLLQNYRQLLGISSKEYGKLIRLMPVVSEHF